MNVNTEGSFFDSMADPFSGLILLSAIVVRYLSDVKDAPDDLKRLIVEVSSIRGLLSTLQDLSQSKDTSLATVQSLSAPNGSLEQFRSALERLAEKLAPVVGLKKAQKSLAWPFQRGEVRDILCTIERQKTILGLALQN